MELRKEYISIRKKILKEVDKVFSSGELILSKNVRSLELNFSKYLKLKYGIGVNSGTDAIQIALMSAKIGRGDEVITVSNTAVPTVSAIVSCGAKPVFVDINIDEYLIDVNKIEEVINKKTRAVIPVDLYGQCADYEKILAIAKKNKLLVIEDCAQSVGSFYKKKPSGFFGYLSVFSFYPTKNLGAYGDGGFIGTSIKKYAEKASELRKYVMRKFYYSEEHGINSRLDEVQAAIINLKLKKLKIWINQRRKIAKIYNELLKNTSLVLPQENKKNYHAFHVYVVQHQRREFIMDKLKKNNIYCDITYPFPIHLMRGYSYLIYKKGNSPITEKLSKRIFSLPMYPQLSNSAILKIVKCLKEVGI